MNNAEHLSNIQIKLNIKRAKISYLSTLKVKYNNLIKHRSVLNSLLNYLSFYNKIIMDVINNHKLYYASDQNVLNIYNLRQFISYQKQE
ncbi:hypothetical protein YYC_00055 [Plasmodium yoelii 17X]|uniref:Uncharacterized protein n=1 Tax=Plasmodium yoelii 17X TaxID=1323249 RepID=V7PV96_PLAYE|nr:hypothetical protein YYC_00055 [Plasmodium yoelii 17X]